MFEQRLGSGSGVTASHWFTHYRCFLPDLAGFAGSNCAAPRNLSKRREWDSNPRWSYPHTRFPSVLLKPLGHLSRGLIETQTYQANVPRKFKDWLCEYWPD